MAVHDRSLWPKKLIDHVERLRAATHLHHCKRLALGGANGTEFQGNPVDLRLEQGRHRAMAFRRTPDLAFGPLQQFAQLLDFGGGAAGASSGSGKLDGLKMRVSAPKCSSRRAASSTSRRLNERSRVEPYNSRMCGYQP